MRVLPSNNSLARRPEHGAYLPFLALMMFVLLAFAGLAIDGSRVFLTQQRLQRAIDAGAISAMESLKTRPAAIVESDAVAYTTLNFRLAGLPPTPPESLIAATVGTRSRSDGSVENLSLDLTGQVRLPLMIISAVPMMPREMILRADARAGIQPIAVMLVLDKSGSMSDVSGGQIKIEALRSAAMNFVTLLDDGDYVGVTSYSDSNAATNVISPDLFRIVDHATTVPAINSRIAAITAGGGTCIACGLRRAWRAFDDPASGLPPNIPRYVVVMTDGTPEHNSSGRAYLDNIANGAPVGGVSCGHTITEGMIRRESGSLENYTTGGPRDIYQTIAESDRLRRRGITLISIGLGDDGRRPCDHIPVGGSLINYPPAGSGQFYDLPWQPTQCFDTRVNPPNGNYRRDDGDLQTARPYLLERIANDIALDLPTYPTARPFAPVGVVPAAGCANDENAGFCACIPLVGNNWPRGIYLHAPSAAGLNAAFEEAFKFVKKPRLVG